MAASMHRCAEALRLASAGGDWRCWAYSEAAGRLVLHGRSADAEARDSFLVFREPEVVRMPWQLDDRNFRVDPSLPQSMADAAPGATGDRLRVILDGNGPGTPEYVICREVTIYHAPHAWGTGWMSGLEPLTAEWHSPQANAPALAELSGATLRWRTLVPSHAYTDFSAQTPEGRWGLIRLWATDYLSVAAAMPDAVLEVVAEGHPPPRSAGTVVRIHSSVGEFHGVCSLLSLEWRDEQCRQPPGNGFTGPLWAGGPAFAEL